MTKLDLNYRGEYKVQGDKRIYTPFRKEIPRAWLTQIRDMAFEKILDDHLFTFKHLLVVPNPYGASVQTALLLFNTSKLCSVRYRVLGKIEGTDFVGETEASTRHRVPIVGLYKGYTNKLKLELLDEAGEVFQRRELTIYARDIPLKLQNIVTKVERKEMSHFPFVLVNGVRFNPIVLDQNGEVRYALQIKTNKMGMLPLQDGRFLFADTTVNKIGRRGNSASCQYHEIDYMGRIYRTYLLDYPIRNVVAQNGDSLFLLTASKKKYIGDCIIELDRNSGEIKKRCPLADVLGTKYQDRRNWAMVSKMAFCQGMLMVSLRRFHTVLALDWGSLSVRWALAPSSIWQDTPIEQCLLAKKDGGEPDGYLPEHFTCSEDPDGTLSVFVYCIQSKGTIPAAGAKRSPDSRLVQYRICGEEKSFEVLREVDVVKCKKYGSCVYDGERNRILSLAGFLNRRSEELRSCIEELDGDSGDVINRLRLCRAYHQAWLFEPDIVSCSRPLEKRVDVIYGHLAPPPVYRGELPALCEDKLKKKVFGNIRVCGNLLLFAFYPSTIGKVYIVGRNHSYMEDYSVLNLKRRKQSFVIALDGLEPDEYQVYVEYDGSVYQLKNEIRIEME